MIHQIYLKLLLARNPIFVKKLFWRTEKSCNFFLCLWTRKMSYVWIISQEVKCSMVAKKSINLNFIILTFSCIRGLILSSLSQGDSYSLNMTRNTCVTLNLCFYQNFPRWICRIFCILDFFFKIRHYMQFTVTI